MSAPTPKQRTLYGDIFDWMLTPLLLILWPAGLGITWLVAQNLANKPYDRALESNATALAQLVQVKGHRALLDLPRPAQEILRADELDTIYYQVLGLRGELLAGERDFPAPPEDDGTSGLAVRLRTDQMRGEDVRVAYLWVKTNAPQSEAVLVQVGETVEKRSKLATDLVKGVMLPQFITLPFTVLLVWLGLSYALKPLSQLERTVRQRKPDDLSPLDDKAVPREVAPLVNSVNDLLLRLQRSMETQKRFLTDAAHQLKTPLAGLRMQADLAVREGSNEEMLKHSLMQIARSSVRATHTVNQLLALARAEASGRNLNLQVLDLPSVVREVVQDSVPRALEKRIDLGYEESSLAAFENEPPQAGVASPEPLHHIRVNAQPTLLKELIRNLLDNAIHYTQDGGMVTVRVGLTALHDPVAEQRQSANASKITGTQAWIEVEDNGPGIPPDERELVFQPFYRALGTHVDGSGLGLSIVREIAQQHGIVIDLEETNAGQSQVGARFSLRFPAQTLSVQSAEEPRKKT
jgi:two-component system, OmpR family, sensor histidine kinase TctE